MQFVQVVTVSIIVILSLLYIQFVFLEVRVTARGICQLVCLKVYKSEPLHKWPHMNLDSCICTLQGGAKESLLI